MKRQIALLTLMLAIVLMSCVNQTKTATLKPLATALADKLGRTPANTVVELPSCGATVCAYNIYYSTEDNYPQLDARVKSLTNSQELSFESVFSPTNGSGMLSEMNDYLSRSTIKGRLVVAAGEYIYGPPTAEWNFRNSRGQLSAIVTLFEIRETGVSYEFDSKKVTGNLVHVQTLTDLNEQ